MPTLQHSMGSHDLGYFQIVAKKWGIYINDSSSDKPITQLINGMIDEEKFNNVLSMLPKDSFDALRQIQISGGRISWAKFIRDYGEFREMGSGRRDREHPDLDPISPVEALWYWGLIGRDFFTTPSGLDEFAYIPDEFQRWLPPLEAKEKSLLGRPVIPGEHENEIISDDSILDFACTLLAAYRISASAEYLTRHWLIKHKIPYPLTPKELKLLLLSAGLINKVEEVQAEPTRKFFELSRPQALQLLVNSWRESIEINELGLIPDLIHEGEWENTPILARKSILEFVGRIPRNKWWSLPSFIEAIKQEYPDFQRTSGDYDSWFIRDSRTGEYLRGFQHWDKIDGTLIRYIVTGLIWSMGLIDLATTGNKNMQNGFKITAIRLTNQGYCLLNNLPIDDQRKESSELVTRSDGRIYSPKFVPRSVRYQVARFCDWDIQKDNGYPYRISAASLNRAVEQGLSINQIYSVIHRNSQTTPPSIKLFMDRWSERGVEARFEEVIILRVKHPEIIQSLKHSKVSRYLADSLGPTTVIVKSAAIDKVRSALAEMGFLSDIQD